MKKLAKLLTVLLLLTVLTCTLVACGGGEPSITSITVEYTQGEDVVYTDTSLDDLKESVVVKLNYSDGTTKTITDYTLSGVLTEGESTITVTYGEFTKTFIVDVAGGLEFSLINNGTEYEVEGYNGIDTDVVIPSTHNGLDVTQIGVWAFSHRKSLTSITIPDSVTSIGYFAFDSCDSLESVIFGENSVLESIDYYAFFGCDSLTSITIPDSVTSIGYVAFSYCTSLTSITIPDSVTSIGYEAFRGCHSLTIYCEAESKPSGWNSSWNYSDCPVVWNCNNNDVADDGYIYTVIDGIRYGIKGGVATIVRQPNNITTANIQSSINYKGTTYAVTSIGERAFYQCDSLESVIFGENSQLESIGSSAFYSCDSLESVTFGENSQLESIGSSAFEFCDSLTSITIPDSVESIGEWAFYACDSLESVIFGENSVLESIGSHAFHNCDSLTSIIIPDSVTSIGSSAFYNCPIEKATIPAVAASYIKNANLKEVVITSGDSIGASAFERCTLLESVTFGENSQLESIGEYAFYNCTSLNKVNYLGTIDQWVEINFYNYTSNPLYYAKNLYIDDVLVEEVVLTNATKISSLAFYNCTSLTSITIPGSVTSIGYSAFYNTAYYNDKSNWEDGVLYIGNHLIEAKGTISGAYTVKGGTKTIADSAFSYCTSLTSITIPDSVTSIGSWAFRGCYSLPSITIPDSVTSIGYGAFYDCDSLANIFVDEDNANFASIDGNLYSKDGKTLIQYAIGKTDTSFTIPDSVTSIGEWAFSWCTSLTSITIPDSVTSIGYGAFYNCKSLTSITIPDSVTSIGSDAFYNCTSLTIYCEATSQPSGWNSNWNYYNRPVYWYSETEPTTTGNYWHYVDGVVTKW